MQSTRFARDEATRRCFRRVGRQGCGVRVDADTGIVCYASFLILRWGQRHRDAGFLEGLRWSHVYQARHGLIEEAGLRRPNEVRFRTLMPKGRKTAWQRRCR